MPRDKLRELQGQRLQATIKRVYENNPVYRKKLDAKGIKPEDIRSVDDLKLLPFYLQAGFKRQLSLRSLLRPYG
jgi:phenylacetate-CoA ligase